MNNISFEFANPWFLLILVVAIPLALIPFFRLKKARRRNRNKITSLVLHLIIILLCTLVLSGFTIKSEDSLKKNETYIVVDVSRSVNNQAEEIDKFVENILNDVDGNNKVGVVTFSDPETTVASPLSSNKGAALSALQKARSQGAGKATDINYALTFTANQFSNKKNAKIVLITDGIDTENNLIIHSSNTTEDEYEYTDNKIVLETVRGIAAQGISIDTAYFEPVRYDKDMQINSLLFEKNVLPTQPIPVKVTVQSQVMAPAVTLKLFDRLGENGTWVEKGNITTNIQKGLNPDITFENFTFGQPGLHTLKVELSGYVGEQIAENNVYYSYVNIEDNKSILIIDGDGKQAAKMKELVNGMGYTVNIVSPANVPKYAADLANYNEVILMNVNVADMPKGYDKELDTYVTKYGGGLFTTGGDRTYFYGGMDGTRFDSMLPVNVIPEDNSVNAIMFVVDGSGSMYYDFNKGGSGESDCFYDQTSEGFKNTPIAYIKNGLEQAAYNIFNKKDYLGIMHFGKPKDSYIGYSIDLPLTSASQRGSFMTALDKIQKNPAKGTSWSVPLQAAAAHLRDTGHKVDKKQIIFITDGSPAELGSSEKNTDFAKLTKGFEEWGITTSVIAVNGCNTVDPTLMNNITTALDEEGNKRFYNCTSPEQFIKALEDECKAASTDTMNEGGNYEVEITSAAAKSSLFDGITVDGDYPQKGIMPNIPQYNGVTVKTSDGVEALLTANNTENKTHDAIYAQWTYGKGRVGSFASDLGSWADKYYTDPEAKLFLENVIRGLLREGEFKSSMWVDYEKKNFTTDIFVNGDLSDDKAVYIDVIEPDGKKTEYMDALTVVGNERCKTSIHTNKEGLYKIHVLKQDASGKTIEEDDFYFTFSYSQEYNTFIEDTQSLQDFLSEVSVVGNGNVLSLSDFEYNHSLDYETVVYDPKMLFSLLSAILFILDIAARKFNFKWPHEWFMKKKEEA